MLVFLVIALIVLSYVLSRSTDVLVAGIKQLAEGTAFEAYGLTTFLVALATSLPELFVGVTAALAGEQNLPLGVAIGSNIANVSLVLGGAALVVGAVKATQRVYRRDVFYAFLIGCLPLLMLFDRKLSRIDGVVLLVVYLIFVVMSLTGKQRKRVEKVGEEYYEEAGLTHRVLMMLGKKDVEQGMLRLTVGSALLIVSADLIVKLSGMIAEIVHIPLMLVGLFMVSVGTSMPEISFEMKTVRRREYMMAFGNVIGSTVANAALILGVVSVLAPIKLNESNSRAYFLSVIAFVVIFGVFWGFSLSKKALERWEGAVLLLMYALFLAVQVVIL